MSKQAVTVISGTGEKGKFRGEEEKEEECSIDSKTAGGCFLRRFFGAFDDDRKRTLNSPRTARARAS